MTVSPIPPPKAKAVIGGLALLAMSIASLAIGVERLDFFSLDRESLDILAISRLPRTLAAVLAGAGLAIAGLVMQTLARNRFVEPATAGTGQSAALGILIVTIVMPAASLGLKSLVASVFALIGTSGFIALSHRLPPTEPYLVPLFGLVYGGVIGAAVTFIAWQAELLQYIDVWSQSGEFSGVLRGRYELLWIAGLMVAACWWVADRLSILALGRDVSVGLGLNYQRMLQFGLVIVSVISALTVVIVGLIPFVGLVVPNIVQRLIGDDMRAALPWVAGSGAGLVLFCDIAGRLIRYPYEVPVGTVLGVVGAAIILWLLFYRPRHA